MNAFKPAAIARPEPVASSIMTISVPYARSIQPRPAYGILAL
jgi:hypothetical protein